MLFKLLALGALIFLIFAVRRRRCGDEIHYAQTSDGFKLVLFRYLPRKNRQSYPVVLCHGLSCNHWIFDLTEKQSLARFLANQGFDCFLVNLRGRDRSRSVPRYRLRFFWSFDDYLNKDLPAIISKVKEITGKEKLHWIGHSMGGMLAYAYLGTKEQESFKSVVSLASPAKFSYPYFILPLRILAVIFLIIMPIVPVWFFLIPFGIIASILPLSWLGYDRKLYYLGLILCLTNVSSKVFWQFYDWIVNKTFRSKDKKINYWEKLNQVNVPLLLLVGGSDSLATPRMCKWTAQQWGGEVRLEIISRSTGAQANYDHFSILTGKYIHKDIYDRIAGWLLEKDRN